MRFGHLATPKNIEDAIAARKKHSPLIKQLWQACVISSIVQIWKARNKKLYEEQDMRIHSIVNTVKRAACRAYNLSKKHMDNNIDDLRIMRNLNLPTRYKAPPKIIECYWSLPPRGWVKANTDGAAKGNPAIAGWGVVLRNTEGKIEGVAIGGLG
ncbi:hypothetical protein FRX31_021554 [Thalictrum thalictroides]|uniref:RNase H type-1 domain-containing protein n=1 Tax=Thalictrum thalictroides TaxID=46969 RepID=A0A7J6VVL5_THATH|nr:hypothetical protein FRX31_021554 [Thalictrum thalictroides]